MLKNEVTILCNETENVFMYLITKIVLMFYFYQI